MKPTRRPGQHLARGFTMMELLVALLVFSFGLLGMVSLQATAARMATEARDRATATFLADQILARMLISDPATAATFEHRPAGGACASTGTASANPAVTAWLGEVSNQLPNAAAASQQIVVTNAATGEVTVRLCWQHGNEPQRSLSVTNQVQWQP